MNSYKDYMFFDEDKVEIFYKKNDRNNHKQIGYLWKNK